jgi:hypothetical protein
LRGLIEDTGSPAIQQSAHRFGVADCVKKRRSTDLISEVRQRAAFQKFPYKVRIAIERRPMQGRVAINVPGLQVRLILQKRLDASSIPTMDRFDE